MLDLASLDERQRLEQLIERAEAARKDDEALGVLDEHRLAHEEVAEVQRQIDPVVDRLLVGQLDAQPDRNAACLRRALVGGLHDPRTAAGDDRDAALGEHRRQVFGRLVQRVVRFYAGRAEDGDRRAKFGEVVEALDEFAHDPKRTPGIAVEKAGIGIGLGAKELSILGRFAWWSFLLSHSVAE